MKRLTISEDEVKKLRAARKFKGSIDAYWWGSGKDTEDIFDLKYLYDDENIIDNKKKLIEHAEESLNRYHRSIDDEDEEDKKNEDVQYDQNLFNQVLDEGNNLNYAEEEEESWDDNLHNVRFHYGVGFVTDYDSGCDEPNARRESYVSDEEEMDKSEINEEQIRKLLKMHRSRLLRRRGIVVR